MFDKNRIIDRCEQVVESIDLILHWSEAINTPEEFLLSPDSVLVFDGCVMRLQIIGESIKKIDDQTNGELLSSFPRCPWRKIIGLRNIISHEYSSIDEAIIFAIIKQSLLPFEIECLANYHKPSINHYFCGITY